MTRMLLMLTILIAGAFGTENAEVVETLCEVCPPPPPPCEFSAEHMSVLTDSLQLCEGRRFFSGYVRSQDGVLSINTTLIGEGIEVLKNGLNEQVGRATEALSDGLKEIEKFVSPKYRSAKTKVQDQISQARQSSRALLEEHTKPEHLKRVDEATEAMGSFLEKLRSLAGQFCVVAAKVLDQAREIIVPKLQALYEAALDLGHRAISQLTRKLSPHSIGSLAVKFRDYVQSKTKDKRWANAIVAGLAAGLAVVSFYILIGACKLFSKLLRKAIKAVFAFLDLVFYRAAPYSIKRTVDLFFFVVTLPFRILLLPITLPLSYVKKKKNADGLL